MDATQTTSDSILQVEHLSMKFGGLIAIGDLSFQARRGEITALIGPNGAGKTTVFNCITGFYKPSEGMIRLNRRDGSEYLLERLPNHEIPARAKVARTFQNIRLFSGMTLLENLLVAQHNKLMKASGYTILGLLGIGGYRKASAESIDLAKFWLEKTDLVDRADDPAGDLPYGAQRRLEIARAMCTGPELLCLDEPAAGLNPKESQVLNDLLIDIKKSTGTSILLIEHDMSVVMQISDHVVVLEYGRKISDGDPASVRNDPRVIAAYLGVDDEEVSEVLAEVGDEQVIEQLDAHPDRAHGPGNSSSMMAGPTSDTIDHTSGEIVSVARGASKAGQVDARAARKDAASKTAAAAAGRGSQSAAMSSPAKKTPTSKPAAATRIVAKPTVKTPPAKSIAATPSKTKGKAAPAKVAAPDSVAKTPSARPAAKATPPATTATAVQPAKKAAPVTPVAKTIAAVPVDKAGAVSASVKAPTAKAVAPRAVAAKAAAPKSAPAPASSAPDKLILIKGIGPVNERKLNEHGVFTFAQIAAWKKADIVAVEAHLAFDGRIAREDWIGQAKALAKAASKPATSKSAPSKRAGAK